MALDKEIGKPLNGFEEVYISIHALPMEDRSDRSLDSMFSPGYEINESDDKYQIAVNLPGFKAHGINVRLDNDGRVLHLSGGREVMKENGRPSETFFEKRFNVGHNVDITKVNADITNEVLTVTAPKTHTDEHKRTIIEVTEDNPVHDAWRKSKISV